MFDILIENTLKTYDYIYLKVGTVNAFLIIRNYRIVVPVKTC